MYLVLELIKGGSLCDLMKEDGAFEMGRVKLYARSMLEVLSFLKKKKVVHGDIKPANIMVKNNATGSIQLVDFGCSFLENEPLDKVMGTAAYKAPEAMLGLPYGTPIDAWSVGCVLAEISMGGQRLLPTKRFSQIIPGLTAILDYPPPKLLQAAPRRAKYFSESGMLKKTCAEQMPGLCSLGTFLQDKETAFQEFVKRFLCWSPDERITPHDALLHPWMTSEETAAAAANSPAALAPKAITEAELPGPGVSSDCRKRPPSSKSEDKARRKKSSKVEPSPPSPSPPAAAAVTSNAVLAAVISPRSATATVRDTAPPRPAVERREMSPAPDPGAVPVTPLPAKLLHPYRETAGSGSCRAEPGHAEGAAASAAEVGSGWQGRVTDVGEEPPAAVGTFFGRLFCCSCCYHYGDYE
ncbi:dual specificity tyrosine-phosphorylation-regulated kinase 3-like isoform X2 [Lethenteron reissneri]|nr:dual specificity tyrosine-phosphorylation-regulated kinase 3-like isoform X2 [Lethenteron reissneri]